MAEITHLSDLNPEILKLPPELQKDFNNRFLYNPSAEYLALRAQDFIGIIVQEAEDIVSFIEESKRQEIEKVKKQKLLGLSKPQLQSWQKLYKEEFNIDIDIDNLEIPEKSPSGGSPVGGQQGFNWLIIVHKSLKLNQIYNKLKSLFNCYKYTDNLDEIERIAERSDKDIYAIWVRDRIEADEELKNKSANQIQEENINPITLEERLLLELFYYRDTKNYLDLNNWTLCAGSRFPDDSVPCVRWYRGDREFLVNWCHPSGADNYLRCRQAVSA